MAGSQRIRQPDAQSSPDLRFPSAQSVATARNEDDQCKSTAARTAEHCAISASGSSKEPTNRTQYRGNPEFSPGNNWEQIMSVPDYVQAFRDLLGGAGVVDDPQRLAT
jgi:hypothetical protein